jgi:hypothetical protein
VNIIYLIGLGFSLFLTGCGVGRASHPTPQIGEIAMNLGIGDLINRQDGPQRASIYLDEIEAAGYRKSVRIVYDRSWGPQLSQWLPDLLRRKGFTLLAILSPGTQVDGIANLDADRAWFQSGLPTIADLLDGVQFANEQWNPVCGKACVFPPAEFASWHNALLPVVKQIAPTVPIVEGDVGNQGNGWWAEVRTAGIVGIDAVSEHLYTHSLVASNLPIWITEAESRQDCYPTIPCYLYTWNEVSRWAKRPGGGILP